MVKVRQQMRREKCIQNFLALSSCVSESRASHGFQICGRVFGRPSTLEVVGRNSERLQSCQKTAGAFFPETSFKANGCFPMLGVAFRWPLLVSRVVFEVLACLLLTPSRLQPSQTSSPTIFPAAIHTKLPFFTSILFSKLPSSIKFCKSAAEQTTFPHQTRQSR